MAGQLNSFVQKFYNLWNTGNDACLNLECHAGKAQIHLQLNLHLQPHLQPQPRHQPQDEEYWVVQHEEFKVEGRHHPEDCECSLFCMPRNERCQCPKCLQYRNFYNIETLNHRNFKPKTLDQIASEHERDAQDHPN